MDVNLRVRIGPRKLNIFVEGFAWDVGEAGDKRGAVACMAPGTKVHLPLARKSVGIEYGWARRRRMFEVFLMNMFTARPVTFFTSDADHEVDFRVSICGGWSRFEISGMTLQTARNHRTLEIRHAIPVPRAVHRPKVLPVRDRQLKEPITSPVQICSSLASRTYDQAKAFRMRLAVSINAFHCCLEKIVSFLFHPEE